MTSQPDQEPARGVKLLHDPVRNKGTAFTEAERDLLGLRGLLPPRVSSPAEQEMRVMENLRAKESDLERYIALIALQDRNETLFYRVVVNHIEEIMPLIYTPTVGKACQQFSHIYRRPRGLYISLRDRGRVRELLDHWPHRDPRIIVVTDGERILGLGDLGAAGMGIPIGKLSLYTACAGIAPTQCLPITLDVGTNNENFLNDPLYLGLEQRRERGPDYDALVEEFIGAVQDSFPRALVQLEDFGNSNAFRLLAQYRDRVCLFDDDIQGTGAVAVAGLLSSMRISGIALADQRVLIHGAGAAGFGIATRLQALFLEAGVEESDLCRHVGVLDSKGLVVDDREIADKYKYKLAWPASYADSIGLGAEQDRHLLSVVERYKPTALIGSSGQAGAFDEEVIRTVSRHTDRPLIMPFSNPTSITEAVPEDVIEWTSGKGMVATGSPFDPVSYGGRVYEIGQGNNVFIFPGLGLGSLLAGARQVTDGMINAAARALAQSVGEDELARGLLYPAIGRLSDVSRSITRATILQAVEDGVAAVDPGKEIDSLIEAASWRPRYRKYIAA